MIAFAITACICGALLAALVLVLQHLAAMRVTDGETATLEAALAAFGRNAEVNVAVLKRTLDDHETRITHLNNRTAR